MNLADRFVAPRPLFFKKLRKYGLLVGAVAAAVLTGCSVLPAFVVAIAGYLATASAVVVTVSQCMVDGDAFFGVR